jgi:hypothetical protein
MESAGARARSQSMASSTWQLQRAVPTVCSRCADLLSDAASVNEYVVQYARAIIKLIGADYELVNVINWADNWCLHEAVAHSLCYNVATCKHADPEKDK